MTREQCDLLSAPLVRTVNDMEDEILRVIAAQLAKDGNISDTSKWRIRQLARSGEMDKKTAKIIAKYSGLEEGFAMAAIEDAAKIEMGYVDNAVRAEGLAALAMGGEASAEVSAMGAYTAFQRQAKSSLNLVNTVMMYKAKQTFVNGVNKIYYESEKSRQDALNTMGKYSAGTVMGQFSLQEATRRCIKEMAGKGIPAFVDKRGREWSPEAYVMMDMRSTLGNTARAAQWARCDEYGIKLVEVSSHLGARPGCAPYQGRIFSRDGSSGTTTDGAGKKITYTPLSQTSYGKPDGLFGINCGHVQYPFFPGCSFQSYFPYPKEENAEMYKNHQKQRYYERQIRAAKRECVMLNEAGDTEGFKDAAARLKRSKESYKKFTESKGLYLHNDRTQVVGFDRSVSSKATWTNRKAEQAKASAAAVKAGGVPSGKIKKQYLNSGLTNSADNSIMKPYEIPKSREERKALVKKAQSLERPIFAEDTESNKFASYAKFIPPKNGYYDVALHGTPTYAEFFGEKIDAYTLAKIIRSRDDYVIGTKVRLLSCSTGNISETGDCFAQILANELGVEVEAPTKDIFVYSNGTFIIGRRNEGELKTFWPRR